MKIFLCPDYDLNGVWLHNISDVTVEEVATLHIMDYQETQESIRNYKMILTKGDYIFLFILSAIPCKEARLSVDCRYMSMDGAKGVVKPVSSDRQTDRQRSKQTVQKEPTRCTIYFQFISVINLYMFRAGLLLIIRRYYHIQTAVYTE